VDVPPQMPLYQLIPQWRQQMTRTLLMMLWHPQQFKMARLKARLDDAQARLELLNPTRHGMGTPGESTLRVDPRLAQQRALLAAQAFKAQLQAKMAREMAQALQTLARDGPEVVAQKLKDKQPLTRWAAVMVAGRKRLHLEAALIDRLSDPYPEVRAAAREALVRLSRGNDFGPLPSATAKEVTQSAQAWRHWLSLQDPPERIPEYLARPLLAEAEGAPDRVRETLPSPQLAEAEDAQP
jgi:hypothetical protein